MGKPVDRTIKSWYNPVGAAKDSFVAIKGAIKPDLPQAPGETPEQAAMRAQQAEMLAKLNDEQNRKLKRLLSAASGMRAFRGSALSRGTPGNRAGTGIASLIDTGGSSSGSAGAAAGGGYSYGGGGGGGGKVARTQIA